MMEEQKRYVSPPSDSPVRLVYDDDDNGLPLLYLVPDAGFWSLRGEGDAVQAKPCRELSDRNRISLGSPGNNGG